MVDTMKSYSSELDNKIKEWFSWNKNEDFHKEAEALLHTEDEKLLSKVFLERIEFGTAGLRGRMGPGYSQMNDLVVIQTAQGILRYLESLNIHTKGIMIGYDGRYNSKRFAELTAGIFLHAGIKVFLVSQVCPTPFVPFGVTKFNTAAGIMVTASHNPKDDNGYKVYWTNGAQIISPHDKTITQFINNNLEPWTSSWDTSILEQSEPLLVDPLNEIMLSYYAIIKNHVNDPQINSDAKFGITYTAMHGVGYPYVVEAFRCANFKELIPVKEQVEPDPEFPTVKFPNPEEGKSALDLSFKTADLSGSPIILANDPDADRLGVAEKVDGSWKVFNGNELGALLSWWLIYLYKEKHPDGNFKDVFLLSSTVSSKIVKTIATAEGFSFEETLTGFKWMGNRSYDLINKEKKEVLFAFEEAIGFMCGTAVLDKDGVSAAVTISELAAYLYKNSETLTDKLAWIYKKYGYHLSDNSYFICREPLVIKGMFENLRNFSNSNTYPLSLLGGKYKIIDVRDLTTGYDSKQEDKKARLPCSKSSQMITFSFDNGFVVTLRTSGTEPKIKYYTELCASPSIQDIDQLKNTLHEMVDGLINEFIQPTKYGFEFRTL
ncbi:phosphopentomutase [Halyomorpha halys]|uniref:phosphopentomutase n=1 Tax=Halyomorpha halys TaxID=286706 RepID=UPI0006D4F5D3|nr:phosphoglucomutase-2 [Halyomorpha halys]